MTKFKSPEPQPTLYEKELLDILMEECAETIIRASKVHRFGVNEVQPEQHETNAARLENEIGDILGTIEYLVAAGIVSQSKIGAAKTRKVVKLDVFLQNIADSTNAP